MIDNSVIDAPGSTPDIYPFSEDMSNLENKALMLRSWLHSNSELFSKDYRIIINEILSFYKSKALTSGTTLAILWHYSGTKEAKSGAIRFTQLASSTLNLTKIDVTQCQHCNG